MLAYYLYKLPPEQQYKKYDIPKRTGGTREIYAPISGIKQIQKRLSHILQNYQPAKFCVHGYVKERSIKTNAYIHRRKRIVINLDLKDFFPSINFGRVRGLFKSAPFGLNDEVATTLAQICCHDGKLPQGAPTSPVISNYICRRLDNELIAFARKHKINYSRYADDITFSTNLQFLPTAVGHIKEHKIVLSNTLQKIFQDNGFTINEEKTRYALRTNRQEVTGLIVNAGINVPRKYIMRIRAMLHAWEKYGLEAAAKEHFEKFNYKHKHPNYPEIAFKNELTGMLNYVGQMKGIGNRVYIALYYRIKRLDSNIKLSIPEYIPAPEGTTVVFVKARQTLFTWKLHYPGSINRENFPIWIYISLNGDPIWISTMTPYCRCARRGHKPKGTIESRSIYSTEMFLDIFRKQLKKINLTNIGKQMSIQRSFLFRNTVISTKYA